MFSKENFIVPVELNITLKIRNTNNVVQHIIKDPTCTVKQVDVYLYIKQSAEAALIVLNFASKQEAIDAHIILRDALELLKANQNQTNHSSGFNVYNFQAPNTVINVDYTITLSLLVTEILNLYVNGVLVENDDNNYSLLASPPRIVWKGTAPYVLDTNDRITLNYI